MQEIRKILVPVDFSDVSRKALNYGISIANGFRAELLIANVIEDPTSSHAHGPTPDAQTASVDRETELKGLIPDDLPASVHCRCILTSGDVETELLATANREQVDLIVMGTHGRRAFARWVLGCVTERILPKISVPMITVSQLEDDNERWPVSNGRFVYATDLSIGSKDGMHLAHDLAKRFGAELVVLHVMLPWEGLMSGRNEQDHLRLRNSVLARLEKSIPEALQVDPKVRWELQEGTPYQTILEVADDQNVDLIVVNLQGEEKGPDAPLGSTSERVIRGAHQPVLSLPSRP